MPALSSLKKHLTRILLGSACVLLMFGHAAQYWTIPFVSSLEAYFYDARVRLFMPGTVDEQVVVVDIDEKSLAEVGRWPWGRHTVAELVRKLTDDYRVAVVGFDVVFAEPDESSGLRVLEAVGRKQLRADPAYQRALSEIRPTLDYDRIFADTLRDRPVVLGYYFSGIERAQRSGALPPPVFPAGSLDGAHLLRFQWTGYGSNLPELQRAARAAGHFNPLVDFDGSSRRVPMLIEFEGGYYESLSLAMLRTLLGASELRLGMPDGESVVEWLDVVSEKGMVRIPLDPALATLVPFRGKEHSFSYLSAVDVLKGRISGEQLRDKVVLIGTTAPGLNDLRNTPVGGAYPGVEIHANLISGMLSGALKEKPGFVMGIDAVQVLVFGGLLALLLPLLSPLRATLLAVGAVAGVIALNFALWESAGLILPLGGVVLLLALLFALNMSWGFFVESRTKRKFTDLFGQYVPPELVEEMARDPESYSMDGRNEVLTVLFSDIRGFTTLSEGMGPRELTQMMNEYLGAMTAVIQEHRGTLDKYIGDAIMAFWGAPVNEPNHARLAVVTALDMLQAVARLAEPFKARGWPVIQIGIGINTGTMTVGDMGSHVRKAYTVMGDAVNLGSRLEGITKTYGVGIVVGEDTRAAVPDFAFRELDRVRVKGKDRPVAIFEPVAAQSALSEAQRAELRDWHLALSLYRAQSWDAAEQQLGRLRDAVPACRLYRLYLERISALRQHPPGDAWDGVAVFETK